MIAMDVIRTDIQDAIEKELADANERFPLFASMHEAAAVIAEEHDEAVESLNRCTLMYNTAWDFVKKNRTADALLCFNALLHEAENLASEACQVAAMCEKAIQSEGSRKNGKV